MVIKNLLLLFFMIDITPEIIDKVCIDALFDIERIIKNDAERKSVTVDRVNNDHSFFHDCLYLQKWSVRFQLEILNF